MLSAISKQADSLIPSPNEFNIFFYNLSDNYSVTLQKLAGIGVEVPVIILDNMTIEIYDKTFIKMGVGYTCFN